VKAEMLLHDDRRRLWSVPLDGRSPRQLWAHPFARVYEIAAAPDGRSLAYSVSSQPPRSAKQTSFFLYLLGPDGMIKLVDQVHNYGSIESPIFLRSLSDPAGPARLYWIRAHDDVDVATGRPEKQVMVLKDGKPRPVRVALRYAEAPDAISGYAGSPLFALTTIRRDNLPTRLEVLRSNDFQSLPSTSLTFWTVFAPIANTDVFTGVAWISPRDYVVPVGQDSHKGDFSLRLYRAGCEYFGSHVVHRGGGIDWGYAEAFWPLLPATDDRVLALGARAMIAVRSGRATAAPWLALNVRTGKVKKTEAEWRPGGWWTFVQGAWHGPQPVPTNDATCRKYSWAYP
jgi:hypothetical protein